MEQMSYCPPGDRLPYNKVGDVPAYLTTTRYYVDEIGSFLMERNMYWDTRL